MSEIKLPLTIIEHSWSDTSIYEADEHRLLFADLNDYANLTEDNQEELEGNQLIALIEQKLKEAEHNLQCSTSDWRQFAAKYEDGFDYYPPAAIPLLTRMNLDSGALDILKQLTKELNKCQN